MLGVDDDFAASVPEEGHRVANHRQVLVWCGFEHGLGLKPRELGHDGHGRRLTREQGLQVFIGSGAGALVARRAERGDACVLPGSLSGAGKKLAVLGVGPRKAAFDVVHAVGVETLGDAELVFGGERDALGLRAVAQGRVVQGELHGQVPQRG